MRTELTDCPLSGRGPDMVTVGVKGQSALRMLIYDGSDAHLSQRSEFMLAPCSRY